jgi:SEC-C motif domain protein
MKAKCLCGSGLGFEKCCGQYVDNNEIAPTAEALMRSRYVAYALQREDYLLNTWHISTRPVTLQEVNEIPTKWLGLEVKKSIAHLANAENLNDPNNVNDPDKATVEFVARFKIGGGHAERLHEISRFVREEGRWFYVDGKILGD